MIQKFMNFLFKDSIDLGNENMEFLYQHAMYIKYGDNWKRIVQYEKEMKELINEV